MLGHGKLKRLSPESRCKGKANKPFSLILLFPCTWGRRREREKERVMYLQSGPVVLWHAPVFCEPAILVITMDYLNRDWARSSHHLPSEVGSTNAQYMKCLCSLFVRCLSWVLRNFHSIKVTKKKFLIGSLNRVDLVAKPNCSLIGMGFPNIRYHATFCCFCSGQKRFSFLWIFKAYTFEEQKRPSWKRH